MMFVFQSSKVRLSPAQIAAIKKEATEPQVLDKAQRAEEIRASNTQAREVEKRVEEAKEAHKEAFKKTQRNPVERLRDWFAESAVHTFATGAGITAAGIALNLAGTAYAIENLATAGALFAFSGFILLNAGVIQLLQEFGKQRAKETGTKE